MFACYTLCSSQQRHKRDIDISICEVWKVRTRHLFALPSLHVFLYREILLARSRLISLQRKDQQITYLGWRVGIRSGEVTPNSPSRPHSSMSQQSASSVGSSNVNLRTRTAASRRPRPASIAGTGVSVTEKHSEHAYFTSSPTDPFRSPRISEGIRGKKERENDLSKSNPRLMRIVKRIGAIRLKRG